MLEASTKARFEAALGDGKVRRFKEFLDGVQSWSCVERIIAWVEVGAEGPDAHFKRDGGKGSADNMRAGGLFRPIHHNRASCAERTGYPFGVEHCVVVRRGGGKDQLTTSGPANSSGSFTTIVRPVQKGLAFRSAWSIVSSSDAARMMRG